MNEDEMQAAIEDLQNRVSKLEGKDGAEFPQIGDDYYYICGEGVVCDDTNVGCDIDKKRILFGNAFEIKEDADCAAEGLKEMNRFTQEITGEVDCPDVHIFEKNQTKNLEDYLRRAFINPDAERNKRLIEALGKIWQRKRGE